MGAKERKLAAARRSRRLGLATLVTAVGATAFAVTATNGLPEYLPGEHRTTVQAAFADSGALRVGDDVRVASVRAGYVDSIDVRGGKAVVTLKLDHQLPVYRDARAAIDARSSLGQKFVELDPGHARAGTLSDGSVLPTTRTQSPVELDDLLDVFDARTRTAAGSTLRQLGGGVGGRGDDLNAFLHSSPALLDDLGTVSKALASDNGADLSTLLRTATALSSSIDDQSGQIAADTRQLSTTLSAIATRDGAPLRSTIRKAPGTLGVLRQALASLDHPLAVTRVAAVRLEPGAIALGQATPPLRGFLRDAVRPLRKVPPVAPRAVHALRSLTPAVREAQTTMPALMRAMRSLAPVVATLDPYTADAVSFFTWADEALAHGDAAGHWLRFTPITSPESLPLKNPFLARDAYPAPGVAKERAR